MGIKLVLAGSVFFGKCFVALGVAQLLVDSVPLRDAESIVAERKELYISACDVVVYTTTGVVAHKSAQCDEELLKVPDFVKV